MIFMLLAIASGAAVSVIMRLSADKVKNNTAMLVVTYLFSTVVGGAYTGFGNLFPASPALGPALGMGVVNGFLYLAGFVLLQINIRRNGVVLSSIFMKLGLLVPMVVSVFLFGEVPVPVQLAGFAIAVAAIVLINWGGGGKTTGFRLGLFLLLLSCGSADAMSKVFEQLGDPALSSHFLFYTFLAALILCLGLMLYKKERPGRAEVIFGLLIGVPNYFASRFVLLALSDLPAVIVYPTCSVSTILVVTLAGVLLFKERLSRRQWTAVGIILVAIVLLNL